MTESPTAVTWPTTNPAPAGASDGRGVVGVLVVSGGAVVGVVVVGGAVVGAAVVGGVVVVGCRSVVGLCRRVFSACRGFKAAGRVEPQAAKVISGRVTPTMANACR
jgi:hypothetical protein